MSTTTDNLNLLVCWSKAVCICLLLLVASASNGDAFSLQLGPSTTRLSVSTSSSSTTTTTISRTRSIAGPFQRPHPLAAADGDEASHRPLATESTAPTTIAPNGTHIHTARKGITTLALISAISLSSLDPSSSFLLPNGANAYDPTDYASDTVTTAVQSLKDSRGDNAGTMKAFENIAEIITEGKGVGGSLSYSGINLERGFVADEDTAIYNPGLSILTESEKERLLDAVRQSRKISKTDKKWNADSEYAYSFLKEKLDPLHMTELKGYLGILPFYGAVLYVGSLAVQQFVRDSFPFVYIASAALVFLPIIVFVSFGS